MTSSKTDLMYEVEYNPNFIPTRSSRVNVKTMIVQGEPNYVMKNHSTGAYYDLDALSNDIWNLIDGKRTLAEIADEILAKWGSKIESLNTDAVKEVLSFFAESNCLKAAYEPSRKKRVRIVSPFEIDVTLIENSKKALKRVHKAIRPLLKTPLLWIILGFIALNSLAFSGRFTSTFANSENFEILGSTIVGFFFYFFIVLGPAIIIHELAHALTLIHYGGVPGEIGTGLFYFGPMFYVDATDSWMLPKRQRIMVMMAGNISTLMIASIIVTWGFLWPFPSSISHVLYMAAFFCLYTTLMNLAPPFETDGYYVLTDLVNLPNLREDSYNYLITKIKKVLQRPTEETKELSGRKKRILLGYAVLSAAWIVYTVYQTLLFTFYMAEDVAISFLNISSAVFSAQALSLAAATISIASILYFAMTVAGYGVMLLAAVRKAIRKAIRLESIHDRDLCVFLYLPTQLPRSVIKEFERKVKKLAEKVTPSYEVEKRGPLHSAVLRIGGTKLAMVQVKERLKKIESDFYSMYRKFLHKHSREIYLSIGINNPSKKSLTTLIKDLGHEIAATGKPEAKETVANIMEQENQTCLYLLNSVFSTIWTIELPPTLKQEFSTLLPSFFAEDLAITDLHGDVEGFKKGTIYGFDSLAKLGVEGRRTLDKALSRPEEYHTVCLFEPIRSRLVFVGRTEKAEKNMMNFGSLFVCQVWCGYLDSLLSETNLTLAALGRVPSMEKEELKTLSEGELFVLNKNLSDFVANDKFIVASLRRSERCLIEAIENVDHLKKTLSQTDTFQTGLLDCVFAVNTENMRNLPKRFKVFQRELQNLYPEVERIAKMTKAEYHKRQSNIKQMKRRALLVYPIVVALSIILTAASFIWNANFLSIGLAAAGVLLNVAYWLVYYSRWKSCRAVKKYPSPAFSRMQLLFLAFAQTLHRFLATSDVLSPMEDATLEKQSGSPREN